MEPDGWLRYANRVLMLLNRQLRRRSKPRIARVSTANRALGLVGWEVEKLRGPAGHDPAASEDATFLEGALTGLLAARGHLNIVQVGANDGKINDPIFRFVQSNRSKTSIVLCEPQPEVLPMLHANYADHPRHAVFAGAITSSGSSLTLHRVDPQLWEPLFSSNDRGVPAYRSPSGKTSVHRTQVSDFLARRVRRGINIDDLVEAFEVQACDLAGVLERHPLFHRVDVLQVDTEGADDDVIYASVTDALRPRLINFESAHLDSQRRAQLEGFLGSHGYHLVPWSRRDTLAWHMPEGGDGERA